MDPENSNTLEDAHLTPSAEAQQQSSRAEGKVCVLTVIFLHLYLYDI